MKLKTDKQKGFTLIELVIVVVVLGILALVVLSQFNGGVTSGAKQSVLADTARRISGNWSLMNQATGQSTVVGATNPALPAFGGTSAGNLPAFMAYGLAGCGTATACTADWSAGVGVNTIDSITVSGANAMVAGFVVTATGAGTTASPLVITYASVPDDIVLAAAKSKDSTYASSNANFATAGSVGVGSNAISWTAPSGGLRSLSYSFSN